MRSSRPTMGRVGDKGEGPASAEREWLHSPPQLAELGRLEIIEHHATHEDVRVAVEVVADTLDSDRVEFVAEVDPLALMRQGGPLDRPKEALDDRRVMVAVDAREGDVKGQQGHRVHRASPSVALLKNRPTAVSGTSATRTKRPVVATVGNGAVSRKGFKRLPPWRIECTSCTIRDSPQVVSHTGGFDPPAALAATIDRRGATGETDPCAGLLHARGSTASGVGEPGGQRGGLHGACGGIFVTSGSARGGRRCVPGREEP